MGWDLRVITHQKYSIFDDGVKWRFTKSGKWESGNDRPWILEAKRREKAKQGAGSFLTMDFSWMGAGKGRVMNETGG